MSDTQTDEGLMQQMAADDPAAFDCLFLRHQASVYNFALRMVGDVATAEDLTQDCFLRVWQARHRYRPAATLRTWLFIIVRRLALNELARRRLPTQNFDDETMEHRDRAPSGQEIGCPESTLAVKELQRAIDRAISQLPADLRAAILLRDLEGLSYARIAVVCGCPVGTVRSRLNAARTRLRSAVSDWLPSSGDGGV
jgi:RNA polymerase sigma-70 factor, ECF subfamily